MHNIFMRKFARIMAQRIEDMRETDRIDGKTKTPLSEYIFWAMEEIEANDGID